MEAKELMKENRNLRKHLKSLVANTELYLLYLDQEMAKPPTVERDREIAKLTNRLNLTKDRAKFFGLDIDFREMKLNKRTQ